MASPVADSYSALAGVPVYGGRFPGGALYGDAALSDVLAFGGMGEQVSGLSGDATLSSILAGGLIAQAMEPRTAMIGDSLTTHLLGYNWSPFFWINGVAASGGQQLIANAGVSGDTIGQMLSRVNNSYTSGSPGLSGLSPLGVVYFRGGTNDARAGTALASLTGTYTSLLNAIKGYCEHVVILSVPPIGSTEASFATKNALTIEYSDWLETFAAANPADFTYVDDSANLRDGGGAQLAGYFQSDGIHNAPRATYIEGNDAATALTTLFSGYGYTSPVSSDAADVYPAQPQWVPNHVMAGTGGSVGSGMTGQVADSWSIGANGGGITATLSKVAADGGDPNQTPWQRVAPTQVTRTGAGESIRITTSLSGRTITTSDPSALDVVVELRFNAFQATYFSSLLLWVQGNTGDALTADVELKTAETITKTIVLRHKMPRPTTVSQSSATLYFDAVIGANNTGAMGSFDFRCLTIRG